MRISQWKWIAASLVVVLGVCTLAAAASQKTTVTKPLKITGGGIAPEGLRPPEETTTHLIDGQATNPGHHTGMGNFDKLHLRPD
jgi:hypothetical protein